DARHGARSSLPAPQGAGDGARAALPRLHPALLHGDVSPRDLLCGGAPPRVGAGGYPDGAGRRDGPDTDCAAPDLTAAYSRRAFPWPDSGVEHQPSAAVIQPMNRPPTLRSFSAMPRLMQHWKPRITEGTADSGRTNAVVERIRYFQPGTVRSHSGPMPIATPCTRSARAVKTNAW